MKILIVDDDATNRMLLGAILKKDGHDLVVAKNGQQAIDLFNAEQPQMVLMDVMMPIMDGYLATQQIKRISKDFIPIIFLTAMTDEKGLAKCVEVGGDDFLTKPYSRVILNAKIEALDRVRKLYNQTMEQNRTLENYQLMQQQEQKYAKNVFNSIMRQGCMHEDIFHAHISPVSLFNGDVVLSAVKPIGGMNVLFGDFTGHGLGAALGALPLSDIFYAMVSKSHHIEQICTEINLKLKKQLPTGIFLAACLLEIDSVNSVVKVWNGAIPGAYILRGSGELLKLESQHLPFAILNDNEFNNFAEIYQILPGDRIILTTDGILEAENSQGEMYGRERFEQTLLQYSTSEDLLTDMIKELDFYTGDQQANDDITLAIIDCDLAHINNLSEEKSVEKNINNSRWSLAFLLYYDTLRKTDPLPIISQVLKTVMGERSGHVKVNLILTELFCNSLDHGLLGLDSILKSSPDGFIEFYEQKTSQLKNLDKGYIHIKLENTPEADTSVLKIELEDSGNGFDVSKLKEKTALSDNKGFCGRGYPLINSYAESLEYNEKGNQVNCVFRY